MRKTGLLAAWGGLFVICAGLGFLPEPQGALRGLLIALAVVFFLPGALLLWQGRRQKDGDAIRLVRNLSALSLGLTLALLVANVASVLAPETVGDLLHGALGVVSVPMFCGQVWVMSLFLWACLLICSLRLLPKRKRR